MEKYSIHSLENPEYLGIVTILDYEIRLSSYLSEVRFSTDKRKKTIVDLALKSGVDEYRFMEYDIDRNGSIDLNSSRHVKVSKEVEKAANTYLQEKKEIVMNSFLTQSEKEKILCD